MADVAGKRRSAATGSFSSGVQRQDYFTQLSYIMILLGGKG